MVTILANTREETRCLYLHKRFLVHYAEDILLLHAQGFDLALDSLDADRAVEHSGSVAKLQTGLCDRAHAQMFERNKMRGRWRFSGNIVTPITDQRFRHMSLCRIVPERSITDLIRGLLALEACEQGLRGSLNGASRYPHLQSRIQRLILRNYKQREALQQMVIELLGVKPGRS